MEDAKGFDDIISFFKIDTYLGEGHSFSESLIALFAYNIKHWVLIKVQAYKSIKFNHSSL